MREAQGWPEFSNAARGRCFVLRRAKCLFQFGFERADLRSTKPITGSVSVANEVAHGSAHLSHHQGPSAR